MKIRQFSRPRARIEMIPLIDSVFLILVYFIFAFLSMSIHRGIPLTLPQATTAVQEKQEHHGVSITEKGDVFFNKTKVSFSDLNEQLSILKAKSNDQPLNIYLYGDERADHGLVVSVMDLIRKVGINRIFVETNVSNE